MISSQQKREVVNGRCCESNTTNILVHLIEMIDFILDQAPTFFMQVQMSVGGLMRNIFLPNILYLRMPKSLLDPIGSF